MNIENDKENEKCNYKENDIDEVIPGLYLGNNSSSYNTDYLSKYNIKYIIRIMPEFDYNRMYRGITYVHIPFKDNELCAKDLNKLLNKTSDYIANILLQNQNVLLPTNNILVHCKRGHHRSAVVVAAFLMKYLKLDYDSTVKYINNLRPCAIRKDKCVVRALYKYNLLLSGNKTNCKISCKSVDKIAKCSCD